MKNNTPILEVKNLQVFIKTDLFVATETTIYKILTDPAGLSCIRADAIVENFHFFFHKSYTNKLTSAMRG